VSKSSVRAGGALRCAIYTRKSSEEGLEQEFNSLHAQREACEAYIGSQRHEGWACLPQPYDDGGRSGGTMDRPALQELLADIRDGKVDVVVVYKIDRLTRSLADFAKIVEIFDARAVSFVSVTQQFNTTTSMGRLTLNVLLSFAQFEREVTGERIRDKIAASKRKGIWMGGVPPLGYTVRDRKLVVVEHEAETVRYIFRRYATLGSVRLLQEELEAGHVAGKVWTSASGRRWGGKPLGRGALYLILRNRIYRGKIVHKNESFPGEHAAIVDPALWDRVQARLAENAVERGGGTRVKNPSLLTGLLFDSEGNRITPTHAVKQGRRYRYYVSRQLITGARADAAAGLRLPAAEIEQIVVNRIRRLLTDRASLFPVIEAHIADPLRQLPLMARAAELAAQWAALSPLRMRVILLAVLDRVEVHPDQVMMHLRPHRLAGLLQDRLTASEIAQVAGEPALLLSHPVRLRRAGKEVRMVIEHTDPFAPPAKPDPALIRLVGRAHRFHARLLTHTGKFGDLARSEKLNRSYFSRLLRIAYLAPDITTAILDGRQPAELTATALVEMPDLPISWPEQRRALGVAPAAG
jgi:site-specific DNA recombinase